MIRNKSLLGVTVAAVLVATCASQLFGGGIPVFDAATFGEVLAGVQQAVQLYQLEQETQQAIKSAQTFFTNIKYNWRGEVTTIVNSAVKNYFGETAGFAQAITTGTGVLQAWHTAGIQYTPPPSVRNNTRQMANLATMNIIDTAAVGGLATRGQWYANQARMNQAISSLENTSLDGSSGTNSEVQQLNQINAGTVLALRQHQSIDAKLAALVDLHTAQAKIERDRIAANLKFAADVDQYAQTEGYGIGNVSSTIQGHRMP
jgi:type IV secretion system protein TrbJ